MKYTQPVIKKGVPDDSYKYQPLPLATGSYPYHLNLDEVLSQPNTGTMNFHMVGDTGNSRELRAQQLVVKSMAAQYQPGGFIYHLGDLVYHFGEAEQYQRQFFETFEAYPGPIFAIAGNHDSDINPAGSVPYQSLDAFRAVFCDLAPSAVSFSGNSQRKSNIQPNTYWTLETPLATFIGLHSNVPKFGVITAEQEAWFREELKAADTEKMLIICVHHAPYSADINHGSSLNMISVLENAFEATGIRPDIVFSGHVHNYQRFSKITGNGVLTPYIVAGAGGFDELHDIAQISDDPFEILPVSDVLLETYCEDKHGFLRIGIERSAAGLALKGDYYTVAVGKMAVLFDSFIVVKA